jgi:hypothetical protein
MVPPEIEGRCFLWLAAKRRGYINTGTCRHEVIGTDRQTQTHPAKKTQAHAIAEDLRSKSKTFSASNANSQ